MEPREQPSVRVFSRILWIIGALVFSALLIFFAVTAALLGVILFLGVALLSALLALVSWAIVRLWPRTRFRLLNFGRRTLSLVLLLGAIAVLAYGSVAVNRFAGDREPLPVKDAYVAVIVVDGASLLQARALLMKGLPNPDDYATAVSRSFPNISRAFLENGAFTATGISVWPSSSIPAHTGIVTGCYPRKTGVMGQRQFDPATRRHTSYIGFGILMQRVIEPATVKTINEWFPRTRSLDVLQIANRGASLYVPTTPQDEQVVGKTVQVVNAMDLVSRFSGQQEIPRIVVMTLPDVDHTTHNAPLSDERSTRLYLKADEYVGQIFQLYRDKGIFDKTLFVLCADHAMGEVRNHVTLDNLMHDLRFTTFQSLKWSLVPAWGSFEANFWVGWRGKFDGECNAVPLWGGNSDGLIYIKGQERDAQGNVTRESWDIRATDAMLENYHVGGTDINVIKRLLDYSPGIGLIFTNPEPNVFMIYSRAGEGKVVEREQNGQHEFQYTILNGTDPLGYAANPVIAAHISAGTWLSDQHWAALTYLEHYPDALRRITYSLGNPRSGTMHLVAADGWDFTPYYVAKDVLVGSHGSLNQQQSLVPIMFCGPGIRKTELAYARTVDILPTILKYFGVDAPDVDGRALPVFADEAKNRAILDDPRNTFVMGTAEDARYGYSIETTYTSYDRRIARMEKATGAREVLVPSVKAALPDLLGQVNASLELVAFRSPGLVFRTVYFGEERAPKYVVFDTGQRKFSSPVTAAAPGAAALAPPASGPPPPAAP